MLTTALEFLFVIGVFSLALGLLGLISDHLLPALVRWLD